MTEIRRFYELLFNEDEYGCFTDNTFGTKTYKARTRGNKAETQYFSINPFHKGTTRAGANVSSFRNMLIEIDEDKNGNKIPREKQEELFHSLGVPFSTLVWSGSKSYHGIICVQEGFDDIAHYHRAVAAVYRVLAKNDFAHDTKVKDPGRLSRAAGALRFNVVQEIQQLRSRRISMKQFDQWLERHGEKVEEPIFFDTTNRNTETSDAEDQLKIDWIEKYYMKDEEYKQGNKNGYQYKMSWFLLATGMDIHSIESYWNRIDVLDHRDPVKSAAKAATKPDPIYVPSLEERKEYIRKLNEEEAITRRIEKISTTQLESTPSVVIDGIEDFLMLEDSEPEVTGQEWMANHQNYIFVGNDYYAKQYKEPGTLKIQKYSTLKRFGFIDRDLEMIANFQGFTVQPGHGDQYQGIVNDVFWNRYRKVNWKPKQGEFPYIKKMLMHIFGKNRVDPNQYEEILDWLTVLIKFPTVKLHQILLYSTEQGTSKTAFGKLVKLLVQENYIEVKSSDMEEKYNSHWIDKLVIHIDEGNFAKPKDMANNLKNYGTSDTVNMRTMGTDYATVPFFGKFIITTNESEGLFVQEDDRRIWARNVQVIQEADKDALFEQHVKEEIDFFTHHLLHRKLKYQTSQGPLYLPQTIVNTGAKVGIAYDNKTDLEQRILDLVEMWFSHTSNGSESHLYVTSTDIIKALRGQDGYNDQKISTKAVGKILRTEFKCEVPKGTTSRVCGFDIDKTPRTSKWYEIDRNEVKGLEDIDIFGNPIVDEMIKDI